MRRYSDDTIVRVETALPRELHDRFHRVARANCRSMGAELRHLVHRHLNESEAQGAGPEPREKSAEDAAAHARG